jgi:hypothetical protein
MKELQGFSEIWEGIFGVLELYCGYCPWSTHLLEASWESSRSCFSSRKPFLPTHCAILCLEVTVLISGCIKILLVVVVLVPSIKVEMQYAEVMNHKKAYNVSRIV